MSGQSPFEPPSSGTPGQSGPQPEYGYQPPAGGTPPYGNTGWQQSPGAAAPGYQQPGYGAPSQGQQPPKKKSKAPWIILGVFLAFLVLLIGGCAAALLFFVADNDAVQEFASELAIDFTDGVPAAEPATCEVDELDFADDYQVFTTVTNVSGVESHYLVDYELFDSNGNSLGTDFGIISNLADGATERDDTEGVIGGDTPWPDVSCEVLATTRVDANG